MTDLSDRQAAAGRQGRMFHQSVKTTLLIEGWTILAEQWRHPEVDVEVDIVATDPAGREWWIECKGSWESSRNGLERTDTTKKALFNGAMLAVVSDPRPYMIITSHPPRSGSAGDVWLERARGRFVDEVRHIRSGAV